MGRGGKLTSRLRAERGSARHVQNNVKTTEKRPGGITGKGFLPGQSGNPGGRPKSRPISERYLIFGELPADKKLCRKYGLPPGSTYLDVGVVALYHEMIRGSSSAAKEIREAIEGRSMQRVELTAEGGGPVQVRLSLEDTIAKIREIYGLRPRPADNPENLVQ